MAGLVKVDFDGDALWATRQDGEVFVAVRPICEALGIEWSSQTRRIQRDAVLSEGVAMMATPSRGGSQESLCLPLRLLNGWLFGIDERRVRSAAARDKIVAYKRECHDVLFRHFMPAAAGVAPVVEDAADDWSRWLELIREGRRVFGARFARDLWRRDDCPLPRPALEVGLDAGVLAFLRDLPGLPDGLTGEPWVGATYLYDCYRGWCGGRGESPVSQTRFGITLAGAGAWKEMRGGRIAYAEASLRGGTRGSLVN